LHLVSVAQGQGDVFLRGRGSISESNDLIGIEIKIHMGSLWHCLLTALVRRIHKEEMPANGDPVADYTCGRIVRS
jgi:hypothetical protein